MLTVVDHSRVALVFECIAPHVSPLRVLCCPDHGAFRGTESTGTPIRGNGEGTSEADEGQKERGQKEPQRGLRQGIVYTCERLAVCA